MVSNYNELSEDFDDLFAPRVTTKRADVGYQTASSDISNTYETLSRDQELPHIGYESSGINLATLFMGNVAQYATTSKLTSVRSTAWNTQLIHWYTITFPSTAQRNNFFKYGGRIIWSATRTGGTASAKNTDWTTLLTTAGTIELGKTNTYRNGSTTVAAIGLDHLTNQQQTLYTLAGTGSYTSNLLTIRARLDSSTAVSMKVIFDDGDSGTIDEDVDGTLTSTVEERKHPTQATGTYVTTTAVTEGS